MTPDLQFCNFGFAVSCRPLTDAGFDWLADNVGDGEDVTELNGAVLIEPRHLEDIVHGARADGLVCHG